MKKILIILSLCVLSSSLWGQNVSMRDTEDAVLYVSDYMYRQRFGETLTGIALVKYVKKSDSSVHYNVGIVYDETDGTYSQKGSHVVFKTFKGNVFTGTQVTRDYEVINNREKKGSGASSSLYFYRYKVSYAIDAEALDALIAEGVQKMRLELMTGFEDFEYKTDVLGGFLATERAVMESKTNFSDDF